MFTLFIGAVSAEEISSDDSLLTDSVNSDLSQINLAVNFEYADDNSKITPTFGVADNSVISQDYNTSSKYYDVKFNSAVASDKINVSVSAPGYLTQYQLVDVNAKSPISFNLLASESYKLGHDVTARADSLLDFKNADEVLAITTAGVPKLNGKTSVAAIDGILNYATEYISYGRGNILMLRQTAVDPIDFCFVVKKGNDLNAVTAITGTMTAEEFVDEQGDSFLYGLEYGFEKSSGMECDSKMEARGNDLKVWIYLEGIDNVPVSEKRQLQESYNESKDSIREGFSLVETLVPAIDTITLYVCEEDGDILAPIELEY